jgi:hypothetical protein
MKRSVLRVDDGIRAARTCALLFMLAVVVSFGYILSTGSYNGDFYGVPEQLGFLGQVGMLIVGSMPYAVGWWMYCYFKARPIKGTVAVSDQRVTMTFFVLVIWFMALAYNYEVGVLGKPLYQAPAIITPFIQLTNRINPFYLGVLFILVHRGSRKVLILGITCLIGLGILRAGLGVFLYIFLALLVRHYRKIINYLKRNRLTIVMVSVALPIAVAELYSLRSTLREQDESVELVISASDVITAKLMGRLSSLSNSNMVVQESSFFRNEVAKLDPLYFQRQALGGIFGVSFIPVNTPERMLINVNGDDFFDMSFMVGVPGNLFLALLISPLVFLLNLATLLLMCAATFYFARKLNFPLSNEFALVLLLYPLTSGVANEFSTLFMALLSFCILFSVMNIPMFSRARRLRNPQRYNISGRKIPAAK